MSAQRPDGTADLLSADVKAAIEANLERRAVIEQTKGALMFIYGIDADKAFELLRTQSQHHNVKLRVLAEQILTELRQLPDPTSDASRRLAADGVLLTAHQRVVPVAADRTDGRSTRMPRGE